MRLRQQAFLIARLPGRGSGEPRYRCIAAFHQQWTHDGLALQATKRFLTLIRQKDNAEIVREELLGIDGKYGAGGAKPGTSVAPCPFALALLAMSWDTDLTEKDVLVQGVSFDFNMLSAEIGCWDTYNDDGIAVMDVTTPENPAYCFVVKEDPLSGASYAGEGLLGAERVVARDSLVEAWPKEFPHRHGVGVAPAPADKHANTSAFTRSLAEASLRAAVLQSIETGNTSSIESLVWLPGKAEPILQVLRERVIIPQPATSLLKRVLEEVTKQTASLDLSGMDLSDDQLIEALRDCPNLVCLNLSRVVRLTIRAVEQILLLHRKLRRLVLMNCPAISSDDLQTLLSSRPVLFYNIDALMHPALFRISDCTSPLKPAITFVAIHYLPPYLRGISIPFLSPTNIAQGLSDLLVALHACHPSRFDPSSGSAMESAFSSAPRYKDESWYERSVVALPRLDLRLVDPDAGGWVFVLRREHTFTNGWAFLRFRPRSDVPQGHETDTEVPELDLDIDNIDNYDFYTNGPLRRLRDMPYQIHDFRSFRRVLEHEGRPVPSEEIIEPIEAMLQDLCGPEISDTDPLRWDESRRDLCPLMKQDMAQECVEAMDSFRARMWKPRPDEED